MANKDTTLRSLRSAFKTMSAIKSNTKTPGTITTYQWAGNRATRFLIDSTKTSRAPTNAKTTPKRVIANALSAIKQILFTSFHKKLLF